jgi:hypothetical protein
VRRAAGARFIELDESRKTGGVVDVIAIEHRDQG